MSMCFQGRERDEYGILLKFSWRVAEGGFAHRARKTKTPRAGWREARDAWMVESPYPKMHRWPRRVANQ